MDWPDRERREIGRAREKDGKGKEKRRRSRIGFRSVAKCGHAIYWPLRPIPVFYDYEQNRRARMSTR